MSATTSFQDAKDTFYLALRDRLAALNPNRTVVVRGVPRTGLLVEENELADTPTATVLDGFVLRWTAAGTDNSEAVPLLRGLCEIHYATAGMAELAGMDRGRALQAMDEELLAILQPASTALLRRGAADANGVVQAVAMQTHVFWGNAALNEVSVAGGRLQRVATVAVFAWKEPL